MNNLLSPDKKAEVMEAARGFYAKDVAEFKSAGAVLSETTGGYVNAEFVIGDETVPTLRFPKRNLADPKWTAGTLRNLDAAITKAQISAAIAEAVRDLPL